MVDIVFLDVIDCVCACFHRILLDSGIYFRSDSFASEFFSFQNIAYVSYVTHAFLNILALFFRNQGMDRMFT